jgi:hypothetical protein
MLLEWSVGGLFFCWVTSRRREVSLGYGWLLRIVYGVLALVGIVAATFQGVVPVREAGAAALVAAAAVVLVVSVVRRRAGVAEQRALRARRKARVAAMTGDAVEPVDETDAGPEFPPLLDIVAPALGLIGLVAAGVDLPGPALQGIARVVVGAAFLGVVSDAMLLGHWYLTQPGLSRAPLLDLVRWAAVVWPFEIAVLLWPTGMASVFTGGIDDGYGGMLGWMWAACALTTIVLVLVTRAALRERYYSAVMSATGLLYLGILTGFGTELVGRALLGG